MNQRLFEKRMANKATDCGASRKAKRVAMRERKGGREERALCWMMNKVRACAVK